MKDELRKKYLSIRNNITGREVKDRLIYNKVINHDAVKEAKAILIYVSYNNEVDTLRIIDYFLNKKEIAVPRVEKGIINFYYIKSLSELKKGRFNILEPVTSNMVTEFRNTVCITPGVCFANNLYRIGYGGGYYDKFFQHKDIYKIGLAYQECIIENIDYDKYDIRMDEVITDKKEIKKRRKSLNN